jgi:hypothetical protein
MRQRVQRRDMHRHQHRALLPHVAGVERARLKSNRPLLALALAVVTLAAACSGPSGQPAQLPSPSTSRKPNAAHGPLFPECGGVSDQTIAQLTHVQNLRNTARNSAGCQWLIGGRFRGPLISFAWFRGSPIGRERKTEELSRTSVDDLTIDGHTGFVAIADDAQLGEKLCDVAIQYQDDFFEWSVEFSRKRTPDPCDIAKELARQSIAAAH